MHVNRAINPSIPAGELLHRHLGPIAIPRIHLNSVDHAAAVILGDPAERSLALELLAFPGVVDEVADTLQFHRLTGYLQGLAGAFTAFYDRCPVLKADPGVRESRLVLCDLTSRAITQGLSLLGIEAPDRM